jgi:hypothetical protein
MASWFVSLLVPALIALLWHGFSLKVAVAIAGEDAPRFFRAAWVSWLGGIAGSAVAFGFSWTLGLALWFFSAWLSAGVAMGLHVLTTALIYKKGLKLSLPTSLGVTVIHLILSVLVNGLLGWFAMSMLTCG